MSIQSEIERLTGAKNDIATSIENQGVTVPSDALLSDMSSLIDQITGDVTSVNGQTGDVVLDAADVGALASDVTYVESINGLSGAVTIAVPSGASEVPQDLGVAAIGSSSDWARADHVHAIDVTRAAADIIAIQSTQPSSSTNELWIDTNAGSGQNYQIPTITEMNAADEQITRDFMSQLGIIIEGNSTSIGASVGQYVIVKNSTISGITDGLYTAALPIPANTAIDTTYLSNKIDTGGLNAVIAVSNTTVVTGVRVVRSNNLVNLQFNVSVPLGNDWVTVASGLPKQIGQSYYFFSAYDYTAAVSTMGRLYNGELAFTFVSGATGTSHTFRGSTMYFTDD